MTQRFTILKRKDSTQRREDAKIERNSDDFFKSSLRLCASAFNSFACFCLLTGCAVNTERFEPEIIYSPSPFVLDKLSSSFAPLDLDERETEWGRELYLGLKFARELDLYRALTCYKRARFLAPQARLFEIDYRLVEAYYLGRKYEDAIAVFESGTLGQIGMDSPGLKELIMMLYDSYQNIGECEKAERIKSLLDCPTRENLEEFTAIQTGDFCTLATLEDPDLPGFLSTYKTLSKSPAKAQVLNALLPGAGYAYVGQNQTAITAFIVNALFILAAYQFFDHGYTAAGVITTSFEMGWYFGGINGAGLAAQELNQHTYSCLGKEYLIQKRLFPILMFQYAF